MSADKMRPAAEQASGALEQNVQSNYNINTPVFSYFTDHTQTAPAKHISFMDLADLSIFTRVGSKETAPLITPYKANGKTKEHAQNALFYALVNDHDDDDKTKAEIESVYNPYRNIYNAFTTSYHQQEKEGVIANRWKVIIPYSKGITFEQHTILATGAALLLKTDKAQSRLQQGFYAPNRLNANAQFERIEYIEGANLLDPTDETNPFVRACISAYTTEQAIQAAKASKATPKPRKSLTGVNDGIIDKVIALYDLRTELLGFGYKRIGKTYLSPYSTSGIPGVVILNGDDGKERCYSHHGAADPLSNTNNGGHALDVFDVICILEYGGDVSRAIAELAPLVDPVGQKERQDEYKAAEAAKADQEIIDSLLNSNAGTNADDNPEPAIPIFDLTQFSLRGMAAEMEAKMLDDKFILGGMAILGQSTVLYAKPNAGKTLLTIWLLIEAIKKGDLNGEDVFYINADDNHKGLTHKLKLAELYGFHMLAPGYNGFNPQHLSHMLNQLILQDNSHGKILILDTVKKFTDIMDKKKGSDFGESVRQFVAHGGSVIMLAHVNKHRDDEGGVVFAGTSDLVDDADCAYTLDTMVEDALSGERTVKFENFKSRGDVSKEEVYRYDAGQGVSYADRLKSVAAVTQEEREEAERQKKLDARLERNREAIQAIKEVIREGITKKTELIAAASERSVLSKRKIAKALTDHTGSSLLDGHYWHLDIQEKNAHVYKLNYGV